MKPKTKPIIRNTIAFIPNKSANKINNIKYTIKVVCFIYYMPLVIF